MNKKTSRHGRRGRCPAVAPRGFLLSNSRGVVLALHEKTGLMVNAHDLLRTLATEVGSEQHIQQAAKLLFAVRRCITAADQARPSLRSRSNTVRRRPRHCG